MRPDQERLEGSRPSVPAEFYWGTVDLPTLDPSIAVYDGATGPLTLPSEEQDRPIVHNPTPEPRCRLCKSRLTITDTGSVCRQCRLEGLYR